MNLWIQYQRFVWYVINSYLFFSDVIENISLSLIHFFEILTYQVPRSEIIPDLSNLLSVKVGAVTEDKNALIFFMLHISKIMIHETWLKTKLPIKVIKNWREICLYQKNINNYKEYAHYFVKATLAFYCLL